MAGAGQTSGSWRPALASCDQLASISVHVVRYVPVTLELPTSNRGMYSHSSHRTTQEIHPAKEFPSSSGHEQPMANATINVSGTHCRQIWRGDDPAGLAGHSLVHAGMLLITSLLHTGFSGSGLDPDFLAFETT